MKHLAVIQVEFLKESRDWNEMSLEDQKEYLKRHPKSKRRLTGKSMFKDWEERIKSHGEPSKKDLKQDYPKNFKEFADRFNKDNYDTILSVEGLHVTNPKGYTVDFKLNDDGTVDGIVQGYKSDIHLGDVGKTYKDLKEVAKAINKSWMKENDPEGGRW